LASTGLASLDQLLGSDGYPDRSVVLAVGAPGLGKEALGYWFTHSGLTQGDFCLYVTRHSVSEVLKNARAFGLDFASRVPFWIARDGGELKCNVKDLTSLSFNIKEVLKKNENRHIRIVVDVLSALLMLNSPETIYNFLSSLFDDVKKYDAVFLGTVEDGMHQPQTLVAMQELFDGVVEFRLYEEGLRVTPLLRIRKMLGVQPQPGYYSFNFTSSGMEVSAYVK
jgi:KaiC/GvpD/RAD55 family RecA-like ATPase